jgi:hypothetical protein
MPLLWIKFQRRFRNIALIENLDPISKEGSHGFSGTIALADVAALHRSPFLERANQNPSACAMRNAATWRVPGLRRDRDDGAKFR